ncbi:MAG: 4Fe-4S binding protein [Oscillibacter sp.]|nr:4Fe-4S binding protein [Oscillibacter sp.]
MAKKGKLEFRADRCKGCELCVTACPMHILKLDDVVVNRKGYHPISVIDADKCIGCASCAMMCPDGIINVYVEE